MNTSTFSPKTQTNLPSRNLNWVVRTTPQAYTFEDLHGNLAEEMGEEANGKAAGQPAPDIEPEEFEAAYQWFYS